MPAAFVPAAGNPLAGLIESQTAHGFSVGQAIYTSAADTWSLAQSDAAATLATDLVAEVIDANSFRRAFDGESIAGFTGLTAGTPVGESATTAGDIEEFDSQTGMVSGAIVSNVLGYAESATEITFRKERAVQA
jgi:hypothetical protein